MGDEDDATPHSTSGGDGGAPARVCEHCGAPIDTSDWYPVTNERDADGSLRLYHFCSEECQDAWRDESGD